MDSRVRRFLQRGALPGHASIFVVLVDTRGTSPGQSKTLLDISGQHLLASHPNHPKEAPSRMPSPGPPAFRSVAKALHRSVRRPTSRDGGGDDRRPDGGADSRRGSFPRLQAGEGRAAGRRSSGIMRIRRDGRAEAACRRESAGKNPFGSDPWNREGGAVSGPASSGNRKRRTAETFETERPLKKPKKLRHL